MDLFFIRHGQSENNKLLAETGGEDGRVSDPRLTGLGLQQAERLGSFLKYGDGRGGMPDSHGASGFGITHLYSSLMIRAVETGSAVSRALKLPLRAWMEIHEEGGIYLIDATTGRPVGQPGSDRAFLEAHFPDLVLPDDFQPEGWWRSQPFEPDEARLPRARSFVAHLLDRHGDSQDRVAVVSHGGFFNLLIRALLDLPRESAVWFTTYNCAVSWFHFEAGRVSIQYLNRVDFLPPEMVT